MTASTPGARETSVSDLVYGDIIDGTAVLGAASGLDITATDEALVRDQFWVVDSVARVGESVQVKTLNGGSWDVRPGTVVMVHGTIQRKQGTAMPSSMNEVSAGAVQRAMTAHRALSPSIASLWGNEALDEIAMRSALEAALTERRTPDEQGLRERLAGAAGAAKDAAGPRLEAARGFASRHARQFLADHIVNGNGKPGSRDR